MIKPILAVLLPLVSQGLACDSGSDVSSESDGDVESTQGDSGTDEGIRPERDADDLSAPTPSTEKAPEQGDPNVPPICLNNGFVSITPLPLQAASNCKYGADLWVWWQISTKFDSSALTGKGSVGVKKYNNAQVAIQGGIPAVLTYKGKDPNYSGNNLYEASYPVHVDSAPLAGAISWNHALNLTTYCPSPYKYLDAATSSVAIPSDTQVCLRNEKVWINANQPPTLAGVNVLLCACNLCSDSYVYPSVSKVDIFDVTDGQNAFVKTEYVSTVDLIEMGYLLPGRKYKFEYRNVLYWPNSNVTKCTTLVPSVEYLQL